jgi:hypothetical protein
MPRRTRDKPSHALVPAFHFRAGQAPSCRRRRVRASECHAAASVLSAIRNRAQGGKVVDRAYSRRTTKAHSSSRGETRVCGHRPIPATRAVCPRPVRGTSRERSRHGTIHNTAYRELPTHADTSSPEAASPQWPPIMGRERISPSGRRMSSTCSRNSLVTAMNKRNVARGDADAAISGSTGGARGEGAAGVRACP